MVTYKITNITNTFAKRHPQFNTNVNLIYVDGIFKKSRTLSPNQSLYLNLENLPIEIHKLRAKGLITAIEVDKNAYEDKLQRENVAKQPKSVTADVEVGETNEEHPSGKKKSVKKVE